MKKTFLFIMAFVLCFATFGLAHVLPDKPKPAQKLSVYAEEIENEGELQFLATGHASKTLQADSVVIFASLKSEVEYSEGGNQSNIYQELTQKLYANGIQEEDVKLEYSSFFPIRTQTETNYQTYMSCFDFTIKVSDLPALENITQILNDNGAQIKNLNYSLSNLEEECSLLIDSAIEDAKEKAKSIFDRENYDVVSVRSESLSCFSTISQEAQNSTIEIKAKVEVVFE